MPRAAAAKPAPAIPMPGYAVPMSVYVDDAVWPWRGRRWAHLMADSLDELHAFAARLGMPRRSFQDKTSGAHYDIDADTRALALALGAVNPLLALAATIETGPGEDSDCKAVLAQANKPTAGAAANGAARAKGAKQQP